LGLSIRLGGDHPQRPHSPCLVQGERLVLGERSRKGSKFTTSHWRPEEPQSWWRPRRVDSFPFTDHARTRHLLLTTPHRPQIASFGATLRHAVVAKCPLSARSVTTACRQHGRGWQIEPVRHGCEFLGDRGCGSDCAAWTRSRPPWRSPLRVEPGQEPVVRATGGTLRGLEDSNSCRSRGVPRPPCRCHMARGARRRQIVAWDRDVDANDMGRRSIVPRHCASVTVHGRSTEDRMIYANAPSKSWKRRKFCVLAWPRPRPDFGPSPRVELTRSKLRCAPLSD
jgi:hypothetical protein